MADAARALYTILALTHAALAAFLRGYHEASTTMEESAAVALEICLLCDAKVNRARAGQTYSAWHAANLARTQRLLQRVGVAEAAHAENMTALLESVCTGLLCADMFLLAIQNNNNNE